MPRTVFVTGATGYIAKHIVLKLLNAGYHVVGSARSIDRHQEIVDAVTPYLDDTDNLDLRLKTVALDLASNDGWDSAMQVADVLMHTASPFPMVQPKDENKVIKPAVDGALRALKAAQAAGIKRVIMTSSVVAVSGGIERDEIQPFSEADWSNLNAPGTTPYTKSKTLAEKAAWDFQLKNAPDMELTVINPGFVVGPPLDKNFGTSIQVIERLMKGSDPMVPNFGFNTVDVRDIADMHVNAIDNAESVGKRFIGVAKFVWFMDLAQTLAAQFPNRKIATRQAPNILMRILSIFDKSIRQILPTLGKSQLMDNTQSKAILGIEYRDVLESTRETGQFLDDKKLM